MTENGNVTLSARPDGSVTENWTLPSQAHTVTATAIAGARTCSSTDAAGRQYHDATANCLRSVEWFSPWVALDLFSTGTILAATDVTQPSDTAAGNVILRFTTQLTGSDATTQAQLNQLSLRTAVDVAFDAHTALPKSLSYSYMLDNDPRHVIEYSINYSDYRVEQGFITPHKIRRYVQRTLQADITINSVSAS